MKRFTRREFGALVAGGPALASAAVFARTDRPFDEVRLPESVAGYVLSPRDREEAAEFLASYRTMAAAVAAVPLDDETPPAACGGSAAPVRPRGAG
jgi:hypothetical protein